MVLAGFDDRFGDQFAFLLLKFELARQILVQGLIAMVLFHLTNAPVSMGVV